MRAPRRSLHELRTSLPAEIIERPDGAPASGERSPDSASACACCRTDDRRRAERASTGGAALTNGELYPIIKLVMQYRKKRYQAESKSRFRRPKESVFRAERHAARGGAAPSAELRSRRPACRRVRAGDKRRGLQAAQSGWYRGCFEKTRPSSRFWGGGLSFCKTRKRIR